MGIIWIRFHGEKCTLQSVDTLFGKITCRRCHESKHQLHCPRSLDTIQVQMDNPHRPFDSMSLLFRRAESSPPSRDDWPSFQKIFYFPCPKIQYDSLDCSQSEVKSH